MDARSLLRRARAELGEWTGAHTRALRALDGGTAAIFLYHRVLPHAEAIARAVEPGMFVTPATFARQLDWLQAELRVLPLADVVAALADGTSLPARACAISFDDGWRDNHTHALPALAARGLPATVFLVASRVGTHGAFWPDEACRRWSCVPRSARRRLARELGLSVAGHAPADLIAALKPLAEASRARTLDRLRACTPSPDETERELLDWNEVDAMARAGITFESHGRSHAILTGLVAGDAERELREARGILAERGHGRAGLLAYPSGAFDRAVAGLARATGHRAAVTTERRIARRSDDCFALPRLGVHEDISASRAELHRLIRGAG